nr:hypothetical protein [Bartonella vinsonii]
MGEEFIEEEGRVGRLLDFFSVFAVADVADSVSFPSVCGGGRGTDLGVRGPVGLGITVAVTVTVGFVVGDIVIVDTPRSGLIPEPSEGGCVRGYPTVDGGGVTERA